MESQNAVVNKSKDCVEYFREYCTNTSIHGFRYFGERRTIIEKLWWLFIFICCSIICTLSIIAVYNKWENSPVIVTFATKPMKIYEIPFPAVTICSQVKMKTIIFNSTKLTGNLTEKKEKFCNYAATMCSRSDFDRTHCRKFDFFDDYFDIMEELTPNFFPINCYMLGMKENCDKMFTPIITDEGICYTANMLDRDELFRENVVHHKNFHKIGKTSKWSIEHGYDRNAPVRTYPERALLSGLRYAFQFEVKTMDDDNDMLCQNSLKGYTVLLHIPSRIPRLSQEQYRLSLDKAVVAAVKPYIITTSPTVIKYSPKTRACYFPSERTLKYFKIYSQNNCQLECLTNYTLALCSCVSYFMPRENGTRICGGQDRLCVIRAEYFHETKDLSGEPVEDELIFPLPDITDCDCMPMCSDIEYNAVISETDWNWNEEVLKRDNFTEKNNSTYFYLSRFSVYFVKSDFIGSERNELYGPTDFLANFGGLLGLFTGFSFLSLMEIIYFLTIRIYANWKLYGFWAGPRLQEP